MTTYIKTIALDDIDAIDLEEILMDSEHPAATRILRMVNEAKQELASAYSLEYPQKTIQF